MAQTHILLCVHFDLDLGGMTLGQGHNTPLVMGNNCVKYYPDPTWQWGVMAWTRNLGMCTLWPWPWRHDLGSKSWHTLGSWTTIVWNIQIQHCSEELWPGHGFWVCVHCDLGSWTIIVWNSIQIEQGVKKLWPGHDVNRWTDRHTDGQTDGQHQSISRNCFAIQPKILDKWLDKLSKEWCISMRLTLPSLSFKFRRDGHDNNLMSPNWHC